MKKKLSYKKLYIVVVFVLLLIVISTIAMPFVINEIFNQNKNLEFLWDIADILSYCGVALSVITTTILSSIAVIVSCKATEVSDRMLKLEEDKLFPYLDIVREKSDVYECCDNDNQLKVKLNIRNIGDYPIQNILLSRVALNKKELKNLYIDGEIQDTIIEQLSKLGKEKNSTDYKLTSIAGLREMTILHSKTRYGKTIQEEENTPFSEWLYFNVDRQRIERPIEFFIIMQNIMGKVFVQKTILYIIQRKNDKKFVLTMHSKQIEEILL